MITLVLINYPFRNHLLILKGRMTLKDHLHSGDQCLAVDFDEALVDVKIMRRLKPLEEFLFLEVLLLKRTGSTRGAMLSFLRMAPGIGDPSRAARGHIIILIVERIEVNEAGDFIFAPNIE